MKRFLTLFFTLFLSLAFTVSIAEAKRLGSGSNIGKQRSVAPQQQQATPAQQQQSAMNNSAPQSSKSKWLGPLAGLAAGLGLAALFSSLGMDGAMGGLLMALLIGGVVVFLIAKFMRKKQQPAMQYAGASAGAGMGAAPNEQNKASVLDWSNMAGGSSSVTPQATPAGNIPADFPAESFLRSAKTSFIRLQAANDRKDLNDVREYTTPEMFAEISMQFQERDNTPQQTQVVRVDANLLEVVEEGNLAFASVRFTGQLSENSAAAENFDEIWHVQKDLKDNNAVWLLAGIQQTS